MLAELDELVVLVAVDEPDEVVVVAVNESGDVRWLCAQQLEYSVLFGEQSLDPRALLMTPEQPRASKDTRRLPRGRHTSAITAGKLEPATAD